MNLYIFAGPNGSGKSTLIRAFKSDHPDVEFVDIDDMHSKFLKSGLFAHIPDEKEQYKYTMNYAEEVRTNYVYDFKTFGFETVFSIYDKVRFLQFAKENGYYITSVFVNTNSPAINKTRVLKRVEEGGHNVPPDKVESRYYKSCENLKYLVELSDVITVYDNSGDMPIVVYYHNEDCYYLNKKCNLHWVDNYLKPYINTLNKSYDNSYL